MSSLDSFLAFEERSERLRSPLLDEAEKAFDDPGIDFKGDSGIEKQMEMDRKKNDAILLEIMNDARTVAPDKAVQTRKLSEAAGVPEEVVEEDQEGVERAVEAKKAKEILDNSPKLKEMASTSALARFGHDDFDNLSTFERLHTDISAGLDTGMANRELGLARRKLMGEAFGNVLGEELTEPQKQELRSRIKEIQTQLQQSSGGSGGFIEAAANAIGSFIEGVPQVMAAGAIGAGSAAGISAVTGPAAPGVIAANAAIFAALELYRQSAGVEGGHVAQDLIDAGVEKDIANNVGEVSGNFAGLLEVAGAKLIASPVKDFIKSRFKENVKRTILKETVKKSALVAGAKTFGKTLAGETATEVGQELIGIAGVETGKSLSDKEFKSITATEIQHQVGEIFKETLKAMTILAIPGATVSIYNQKKSADQAASNQEYLRSMGENVQASKLKQRDGETHKEFSKRVHEGTSVDSVYIEAEKLQEVFQDDTGLLVEEIGATDQFEDAMARGGDIVIPLSVYTDKIAGDIDAHNKIMPHAKFDAKGLTAFRAEEMVKDEAAFKQKADRILKEQAGNTEFISSAEEVFQGVREQLVATGRFNDETVDNYAALHQAFSVVKAKQLGKTPAEVYEMFGLKVQKGEQVSDQQTLQQQALAVKRTPEFQSFFEGSQIVDEAGEPLVVYHGTTADFSEFKDGPTFFSTRESTFNEFTRDAEGETTGSVIPVFLSIKNPADLKSLNISPSDPSFAKIAADLKAQGFDGAVYGEDVFIAFDQNQIKSIFNERPTDSADILNQQAAAIKRSPEFQAKFKDTKVVDQAGEPLVVYHGTQAEEDFGVFKTESDFDLGAHFGTVEQANDRLGTLADWRKEEPLSKVKSALGMDVKENRESRIVPVYLNIKNPLRMNDAGDFSDPSQVLQAIREGAIPYEAYKAIKDVVDKGQDIKAVKNKMEELGYDGVVYQNQAEGPGGSYIAFSPEQIKSIFNERPTDGPDILNQEVRSRGLYSAVEQAFQDMKIPAWKKENGEANGKDVWAKLKTMPGIKQEEIKWLTVEEFLTGNPKAKFTRQEVISFAEQNGVTVETVVADQEQDENFDGIEWTEQRVWDDPEAWQNEIEDAEHNGIKEDAIVDVRSQNKHNIPKEIEGLDAKNEWIEENYESEIDDQIEMIAQTRYMENPIYIVESDEGIDLSLSGNDDVGWSVRRGGWQQHENAVIDEPTYSLGEAKIQAEDYARENDLIRDEGEGDETVAKWSEYVMPGYMENYRELKLTLPDIGNEFYEEAHFPDPNIVAFLRVNDRELSLKDSDQKLNTYFIDEFQSDWHQQGRQKGYSTGRDAGVIEEQAQGRGDKLDSIIEDIFNEAYKKDADPAEADAIRINREDDGGYIIRKREFTQRAYEVIRNDGKAANLDSRYDATGIKNIRYEYIAQAIADSGIDVAAMKEETAAVASMEAQVNAERYGVPDAPFKGDSWMALGLKQAILDAVDNGYEAIAWADADVLSNRWSERYEKLYRMQYDKKMPAIVKRLTGIESKKVKVDESLTISPSYHIIPITPELKQKVRGEGFTLFQSAAPLQKKPLKVEPSGKKGQVTNWDIGQAFTERHEKKHGRKLDPMKSEEDYKLVLKELDKEYKNQATEQDAGADWYIQDINDAVEVTKLIIPELADPNKKNLFLAIVAFTSPNNDPLNNWEVAVQVMQGYLQNGKIPTKRQNPKTKKFTGKNLGVKALRTGTQLLQKLIDQYGEQGAVKWISKTKSGKELAELRRDSKLFTKKRLLSGYVAGETNMSGRWFGAAAMGPKVSEFFLNVAGLNQNALTIDLWAARTYNRHIGRLLDVPAGDKKAKKIVSNLRGKAERDVIKRLFTDLAKKNNVEPSAMQAALWYFEQRLFRNHGATAKSENFSSGALRAAKTRKITVPGRSEDGGPAVRPEGGKLQEVFQSQPEQARVTPNWYYSLLAASFNALPDTKTQPQSAKGWKQLIKKLGIKNQELEWTAIFEWLDTKTQEAQILALEEALERRVKQRDRFAHTSPDGEIMTTPRALNLEANSYKFIQTGIEVLEAELAAAKSAKGPKITKSEISNYLFNNGVKVETVEIDTPGKSSSEEYDIRQDGIYQALLDADIEAQIDIRVQDELFGQNAGGETPAAIRERIEFDRVEIAADVEFRQHSLLLELSHDQASRELGGRNDEDVIGADLTPYTFKGGTDESSLLLKIEQAHPAAKINRIVATKFIFHSSEIYGVNSGKLRKFFKPHMILNEEGATVLLPAKYNSWSDYVNDKDVNSLPGHKDSKGVFTPEEEMAFDANVKEIAAGNRFGIDTATGFQSHVFPEHGNIVVWIRKQTRIVNGKKILVIDEIQSDFEKAVRSKATFVQAPFTDSQSAYVGLAMKKIITYAVENGFDRVEWTTGSQQSERYRSQLIDNAEKIKYNPTTKQLSIVRPPEMSATSNWVDVGKIGQKNLPGMVGKDVARTLLEEPLTDGAHLIETGNVEISDKGMVDFYDRLVPDIAAKMVKSITGEKPVIEYEDPAPDSYDAGRQPGFDLDGVKAAFEGSRPSLALFQEKRGSFQFAEDITKHDSVINLFEAADLSTFLHESGHFFFEATRHLANQPGSPQEIKDDMNTLLSFVGVDDIDKWNKMSLEERREGHERVARAFEAYLFEGRAPSENLAHLFRRFRSWLVALYKHLSQLKVNLNDDVRSVFDRMLATDEEIRLARESEAFRPLWDSRETAGMGQEEWANYQKQISQDEEEADELLQTRALRDMRYMEGARGKVLSDMQRVQRERRTGVKKSVSIEVANQPVYKAKQFLRTPVAKRPVVKSNPNVVDPTRDSLFTAIAKLGGIDRAQAKTMWGIDPTDKFPTEGAGNNPVVRATKGHDLDKMAGKLAQKDMAYLPVDEHGQWDLLDFEERFMDMHLGNRKVSAKNDEFDVSEAYENFLAEEEGFVSINEESGGKLALQPLIELYGNGEDALWRQLPLKGRYAMVTDEEHGFPIDEVAKHFGFGQGGGDKMIQALVAAPDMRVAVEEETDARMLELYGDLNTPAARSSAITEALHGEMRTRVLHTEMKVLAKKMGSGNVVASAAKRYAADKIARMKIIDIRPNDYLAAERRANNDAEKAIGEGRIDLAADRKRAAILNHHFAKEATKALGEVDRALRYFNRLDGKASRERLHSDYTSQIDRLLSRYDLRKSVANKDLDRRQTLSAWVESEIEKGNSPVIDGKLLDEARLIHYRTIPVEELRGLRDAVTNIEHLGKLKNELLNQQAQRFVDDAARAISKSINKHFKQDSSRKSKTLSARLPQDMTGRMVDGFYSEHRKLAHLGFEADGFEDAGPFWEAVVRPMNARADWEAEQLAEANKRLGSLFDAYSATEFSGNIVPLAGDGDLNDAVGDVLLPEKRLYKRRFFANVPDVRDPGMGISLSRMEQIMIGLNWGNADNRRRVMDGYGWDESHVDIVIDGLDARDWKFIQGVWDYFDEFWPEIEAKEKRVSGVAPDKVEALPVITKFGQFRGGYFPISSDEDLSQEAFGQQQAQLAKDMMRGGFTRATTAKGHTEARSKGKVSQPIRADFGVIFQHVNQVIHDLAWHEFLIDTNKIVNHEEVKTAITARMGQDTFKVIGYTLQDIAAGDINGGKAHEKAFNYLRSGVSIAAMGWNLGTALLQPFGLTQGMARVGTKWVLKGMLKSMGSAASMNDAIQDMLDSSSFMRLRAQTMNREIREIQSKIGGAGLFRQLDRALFKKLPKNFKVESVTDTYFWLIAKAQMVADAPIWMGAREKALAEGRDPATAIELANQAVIDTQGSGHIKDLAGVQRGGPLLKLFTNFLSYFQTTFNLTMDKFGEAGVRDANPLKFAGKVIGKSFTDPKAMGLLAVDMMLLYTIPIVLTWYLREALLKGECDHGMDTACVLESLGREHVGYALSGMIGLREMNGLAQGFSGYKGPAGTRFFAEATTLGVKAGSDVQHFFETGDLEISEGTLKAMNRTGGVLFHYPSVQMERVVTGYMDLQSGKTDIPTAPLFGYSKE